MERSEMVEKWIRAEAGKLETFFDRIMGCRAAIEVPHSHHRKGSLYHVRVDLTLPGAEIVVKREPSLSNRARQAGVPETTKHLEVRAPHKVLRQAINDAFKAAGRRLQDYVRRRHGDVKTHEPRAVARVSKLLPDEGYGFLMTDDGREIYFHEASFLNQAFRRLKIGTFVSFVEEQGERGPQASTVRIVRKRAARPPAQQAAASTG